MATTLNTREYQDSHGKAPRGHSQWGFRRPGTLTECKKQPGGRWIVCP